MEPAMTRAELEEVVLRFTEAFNRDDLDEVMSYFAADAVYDEFTGRANRGKAAIRDAFVPQFCGDFGKIRFHPEDLFVDVETGKALIRWTCTIEREHGRRSWRGLDVLRFEGRLLKEKLTYAKAERPVTSG